MKNWNQPEVVELNITETAHWISGEHLDGGFVGDGLVSGHQTQNGEKCVGSVTNKWTGETITCDACGTNGRS